MTINSINGFFKSRNYYCHIEVLYTFVCFTFSRPCLNKLIVENSKLKFNYKFNVNVNHTSRK